MAVSFNTIPQKIYTPLFYAEVDNSAANTTTDSMQALLIGPMLTTGTATASEVTYVSSAEQAAELFGHGSLLHRMVKAYRDQDGSGTLYCLPLADPGSGVAATKTVTFTGNATEAGTINLYVGFELVQTAVASGETASDIAGHVMASINARTDLPVTANAAEGTLTLTAKHKGLVSEDFAVNLNLLGATNGQILPAGVSAVVAKGTAGTGVPDIEEAFEALKDEPFEFIGLLYSDKTSLDASKAAMTKRWAYDVQLYGHVYTAKRDSVENLLDIGDSQNDEHLTCFAVSQTDPNFAADRLGAAVGQIAVSVKADPARPFQTLELTGISAPRLADRFSRADRESLLALDNIGEVTADTIVGWFKDGANMAECNRLLLYITPQAKKAVEGGILAGQFVVLTGTLPTYKRSEAQKIIEENGGICQSSVTGKTTLVLAGEEAGSKLEKAQKLGIKIIDEAQFRQMLGIEG